jgi:hypothetical protein
MCSPHRGAPSAPTLSRAGALKEARRRRWQHDGAARRRELDSGHGKAGREALQLRGREANLLTARERKEGWNGEIDVAMNSGELGRTPAWPYAPNAGLTLAQRGVGGAWRRGGARAPARGGSVRVEGRRRARRRQWRGELPLRSGGGEEREGAQLEARRGAGAGGRRFELAERPRGPRDDTRTPSPASGGHAAGAL